MGSHFVVTRSEAQDLREALLCEIDKHKHEKHHSAYLQRLVAIQARIEKHLIQDDGL